MIKIKDIIQYLQQEIPLQLQESWDNSGLLVGASDQVIQSVLLTVDVTEEVVEEAVLKGANLILAHHPIIFKGIKSLTGKNYVERTIIKAIRNNIAICCMHTNLDVLPNGVSQKLADKLYLTNTQTIDISEQFFFKVIVFVPKDHSEKVQQAMFKAGAGQIGNYDHCSYQTEGEGRFRALQGANPFVGDIGQEHFELENRVEVICPEHCVSGVIAAAIDAHPYEEPAYDIVRLQQKNKQIGLGKIGTLETPISEAEFIEHLKSNISIAHLRHSPFTNKLIQTVAVCGGSGSFLINKVKFKADAYVTADIKYHEFFDAEGQILLADIGHYESEQFSKEIFYDIIHKKFSNFAVHFSEINTNPINFS